LQSDREAIGFGGRNLWVASTSADSVTEVRAGDGVRVRVLSAHRYRFGSPAAVAVGGGVVWVANGSGDSVTEVRARDGALVRVVSGRRFGFSTPSAVLVHGSGVWVANRGNNSLTEISARSGALVRRVSGRSFGFRSPAAMALAGGGIWVVNSGGNSVTEVRARDGALVRRISGSRYGFNHPSAIAAAGGLLWVISPGRPAPGNVFVAQTRLNPRTGALVRVVRTGFSPLPPAAIIAGGRLWVGLTDFNPGGGALIEENAQDGTVVRDIGSIFRGSQDYNLRSPFGFASDGPHLWVANNGGALTELPAGPPPAGPVIRGCVSVRTRVVTVPLARSGCGHDRTAVSWQRNGPRGPSGADGWPDVIFGPTLGLHRPAGIAQGRQRLWVTNLQGNSVTELNAGNGSLIRVIAGDRYHFGRPVAAALDGPHLWVASLNDTVTELNADDGSLVRILAGRRYRFGAPAALIASRGRIWVVNQATGSVTEINASDGRLIRVVSASRYRLRGPSAIASDGTSLWVANTSGNSVTQISAADGSLVRVISGPVYGFSTPRGIAVSDGSVWVANSAADTITQISTGDGSLVRNTLVDPHGLQIGHLGPGPVVSDGGHLWVVDMSGDSVTEIDASDAGWVRRVTSDPGGFDFSSAAPAGIAAAHGTVWVTNPASNSITRLPQRGAPAIPGTAIHACVSASKRTVTIPLAGSRCPEHATATSWNITGRAGQAAAPAALVSGPQYHFDDPAALAVHRGDMWVANAAGNSLTEVNTASRSLIRVLSAARYRLGQPRALLADHGDIWVANTGGNSLTEVNAGNGQLIRTVSGASYQLGQPRALAADSDGHVWVASRGGNSLTEVNAHDGSLVRTVSGASYIFSKPSALAFDGTHIWVANDGATSLTQVNASDGSLARIIQLPAGQTATTALLFADGHIWASTGGTGGGDLLEFSTAGDVVASNFSPVGNATTMAFDGTYLWLCGGGIAQVNATILQGVRFTTQATESQYGLIVQTALAVANGRLWSANSLPRTGDEPGQNTLTELPAPSPGE
jgi:streptogramin lyase